MIFDNSRTRRENRLYLRALRGALRGDKTVARIIWARWGRKYVTNRIAFDPHFARFKFDVEKRCELINETYARLADYLKRPSAQLCAELGLVKSADGTWLAPESLTDLSLPFDARIKVYARRCLEQSVSATSPKTPKFSPPSCKEEDEPAEILERWERISIVNNSFAEVAEEDFVGAVIFRATEVDGLSHRALEEALGISEESCRARKTRFRKKLETKIRRKFKNNERPQTPAWGAVNAVEPPFWNLSPEDDFEMTPRDVAAFEECCNELKCPDHRAARQRELQERAKRDEENAERWTKQRKRERRAVNEVNPPDHYFGEIGAAIAYAAETVSFRFEEATRNEEKPRWRATFVVPPHSDVRVVVASSSPPRYIKFGQSEILLNGEGEGRLERAQFLRETRARGVVCSFSNSDGLSRRGRLAYNFGCAPAMALLR